MGCTSVLFLVFLVLKLTGVIAWSWLWVFAPVWGTAAVIVMMAVGGVMFAYLSQKGSGK